MNMDGGTIAWAAMMSALVVAYVVGMKRDPSLNSTKLMKMAAIWVAIVVGAYLLVRTFTGMS